MQASALIALALASPLAAQSAVWVVDDDGGPGVDFDDLAPAVAAAQAGDVVLIRPGAYGDSTYPKEPLVLSKGLTLVGIAAPGSDAVTCGPATVTGLPAGEELAVRGIAFHGEVVSISANEGAVWFEECSFTNTSLSSGSNQAVHVAASTVVLLRCSLSGGSAPITWIGSEGLFVEAEAAAYLYDCDVRGGDGMSSEVDGSAGASVDGFLFASGSSFHGGHGGPGHYLSFVGCYYAGAGGQGLLLKGEAHELQCAFQGGHGGAGECGPAGAPGEPVFICCGGVLAEVPGQIPRSMSATSPVSEGGTVGVSLAGAAGDLVLLAFTSGQDALFLPELHGVLLLAQPFAIVPAGVLAPDGTLDLALPVGMLPPGAEGLSLLGQGAFFTAAGPAFLGPGASVLLTDSSIPLL